MDDQRVADFERELWTGGRDIYERSIAADCLMALPAAPFVMSGEQAIEAVSGTPRWSDVEFGDLRVSRPRDGLIVIAYKANARRGEQAYEAYCTSTYCQSGNGDWQVIQHQQTVPLAGD